MRSQSVNHSVFVCFHAVTVDRLGLTFEVQAEDPGRDNFPGFEVESTDPDLGSDAFDKQKANPVEKTFPGFGGSLLGSSKEESTDPDLTRDAFNKVTQPATSDGRAPPPHALGAAGTTRSHTSSSVYLHASFRCAICKGAFK